MAEAAPLTSAHAHVRKATAGFQKQHWTQAGEQHHQASADFARVGKTTSDAEALRVLKLLEEQHEKLARIIKNQNTIQRDSEPETSESVASPSSTKGILSSAASTSRSTPRNATSPPARAGTRISGQARDSSPSLARDIASRRGIPQPSRNALSSAAQARARQLSPESARRATASKAAAVPSSMTDSKANLKEAQKVKKAEEDDAFSKFYSNLTTGTVSKLSSVLAYAGLPLTADDMQPEPSPKQKSDKRTVKAANDPDVKKLFSKAALDAIEDEHRQRGTLGHGFGPAESFYVVPKSGGTYSYADIIRPQQGHLQEIGEDEEAEFVDAKDFTGPSSPKHSRSSSDPKRSTFGKGRTQEELELENATLKQTLEQVASRLSDFEAHAQDASMAALTQSMVSIRPQQQQQQGGPDAAIQERLRQLEAQVEQQVEERQKLEGLAAKQEKMLRKYHSKWDEIKKSAKEKDKAKRERAERAGEEGGGETA